MSQNNGEAPLEWTVWPYKESARRTTLVIAAILAVGVLACLMFKAIFWGVFSVAILFASLHTYFTRTTYRLDAESVTVRSSMGTVVRKWATFKRYYIDKRGVTLSPFAKPSRLEPFRSTRLLYGGNRDEVVAFISKRIDRDAAVGTG
jgi:preprotein translocase subunit SecE